MFSPQSRNRIPAASFTQIPFQIGFVAPAGVVDDEADDEDNDDDDDDADADDDNDGGDGRALGSSLFIGRRFYTSFSATDRWRRSLRQRNT